MKFTQLLFTALLLSVTHTAIATEADSRTEVVTRYLADLQRADYKDIATLFEPNGIVMSTSRGKVNAKEFFYAFLPNVQSAKVTTQQVFSNAERRAARFHLELTLKDGESDAGEYMDEFVFSEHSDKLSAVYMFENTHFQDTENNLKS